MWVKYNIYVLATSIAGAIFVFAARQWDFDVWEVVGNGLNSFDNIKGHEIIFVIFFLAFGYSIDAYRKQKRLDLERNLAEERLQAMKSTMTTVHDIVNNALNSLQLFRLEAQKHSSFSSDAIDQFDDVIFDTAKRLKTIQTSEVFVQNKIADGIMGILEN